MFNQDFIIMSGFFLFGLLFGSFGNVIIHRLPLGESVVHPRSRCPHCLAPIAWFDNIPVASWILLRGKCRHCLGKIHWRYPFVELLMGFLFAVLFRYEGLSWTLLEHLVFTFGLVICTFIDFDHMIIPDEFSLSGIVLGLLGAWLNPDREFMDALFGVLMGGGFLWLLAWLYYVLTKNDGMGGGDIKLLAWIGAVLGVKAVPFVIVLSAVVGSVVGLVLSRKSAEGLKTAIPFGPYLALASIIFILGGHGWALEYWSLFFSLNE